MPLAEGQTYVVKPKEFVLGENRGNSHDSRMWFGGAGGGVPAASVIGVAGTVLYSSGLQSGRSWLSLDEPHLPPDAASLEPAFKRCLEGKGN